MNAYDLKLDFETSVEIAEIAYKEGKRMKAAYWIGQATVYAVMYETTDFGFEPLPLDTNFKVYKTWVQLRAICQES